MAAETACACPTVRLDGGDQMQGSLESNLTFGAALLEREPATLQDARHLIVATDGALMLLDEEFGEDRLTTIVEKCRHLGAAQLVAHVFDQIDAFAAETPQFDITVLAIKRLAD